MGEKPTVGEVALRLLEMSSVPLRAGVLAKKVAGEIGVTEQTVRTALTRMEKRGILFKPQSGFYRVATPAEKQAAQIARSEKKSLVADDPVRFYDLDRRQHAIDRFTQIVRSLRDIAIEASKVNQGSGDQLSVLLYALLDETEKVIENSQDKREAFDELKRMMWYAQRDTAPTDD